MMVVDTQANKRVKGLMTSRDLLRIMAAKLKDGDSPDSIMDEKVGKFMTPISQVIFVRPEETVGMCRTIMAKLGIKALPVLSKEGQVEGLITARDISDFGLEAKDRGGKTSFLRDVSERVGLSSNTSMAEPPPYLQAHLALEQTPLFINVGVAELPHPFKTPEGCGMNHRGKFISPLHFWITFQVGSQCGCGQTLVQKTLRHTLICPKMLTLSRL
jgi:hypothetical protein